MKMPALALFERALRLESRSAVICWVRAGLLAILLIFLYPLQRMAGYGWYGAPGLRFLQEMVWLNLALITLAGLSYFASAITEEKEEMTLGLLRMTDLSPVAILLGKSTSRLIGALLLLLVQVPFILLAVTLGGVSTLQIAAAYGTLLAYLFLLCNLALLFSVMFRNTGTAGAFTILFLVFFFFGHFWLGGIEQSLAASHNLDLNRGIWPAVNAGLDLWRQATPINRLGRIFQTGFNGAAFEVQVISNLVLGILFFLLAWLVFDRFTREEREAGPGIRVPWRRKANRSSRIPSRLVGARAITWKDFTFISGGRWGLIIKAAVIAALVALCNVFALQTHTPTNVRFEGAVLIWVSLVSTAVWLAIEASRMFHDEIRWKTLSSLVLLPISIRELAYRKVAGALLGTLPLLVFAAAGLLLVPDALGSFLDDMSRTPVALGVLIVGILQYLLFLHLTAFLSLVVKRGALPLAVAIQYVGGTLCLGFMSPFLGSSGPGSVLSASAIACLILTLLLHAAIGSRLMRAAAEE